MVSVPTSVGDGGAGRTREAWRDCWMTPPGVIDLVRQLVGVIHLDAAAAKDVSLGLGYLGRDHQIAKFRDGTKADWVGAAKLAVETHYRARGLVGAGAFPFAGPQLTAFCNPPYSEIAAFSEACARWGREMTVALLCYERRETAWWRENVHPSAAEVHTLHPRVRHINPRTGEQNGSPNLHSCLAIFRPGVCGPPMARHACWRMK